MKGSLLMRGILVACGLVIALAACRSAPTTPFDANAAAYINTQGKGKID